MSRTTRRLTAAGISLLLALVAPLVVVSSAAADDVSGTPLGINTGSWQDITLDTAARGVPYSSSVQGPASSNFNSLDAGGIPDGLSASIDPVSGVITLSGTPTTGGTFSFFFQFGSDGGYPFFIAFDNFFVDPNLAPTTTTVASEAFFPTSSVTFSATVTGSAPTGTVAFRLNGSVVGSGLLDGDGVATYSGPVSDGYIGGSPVLDAVYYGDNSNAISSSSTTPAVYLYASDTVTGVVTQNGAPVGGDVELLSGTNVIDSDQAGSDGVYSLTAPVTSLAEAQQTYLIFSPGTGIYYSAAAGAGQPNATSELQATATGPADWGTSRNLYLNTAPTWTDTVIADPELHVPYSDEVAATGGTISYSVVAGALPSWLGLDPDTGSLIGADPSDEDPYSFTIAASNGYAAVEHSFTINAADDGVAPVFTDSLLATPQAGASYSDAVAASGDATITYSSTGLPAGLVLDSTTGAITGTPTTAGGPVTAVIVATNDAGFSSFTWNVTVAAATEVELTLDFEAGDTVASAAVVLSAAGLAPDSAVTLDLFSTPVRIYSGTADTAGGMAQRVAIPVTTAAGSHSVVLTVVALDGTVLTRQAWFSILADGTIGAISYTGAIPAALASTGSDPLLPAGLAVLLLAAGVLALRRRRSQQA